jgi:CheY-like chemotaxis protein
MAQWKKVIRSNYRQLIVGVAAFFVMAAILFISIGISGTYGWILTILAVLGIALTALLCVFLLRNSAAQLGRQIRTPMNSIIRLPKANAGTAPAAFVPTFTAPSAKILIVDDTETNLTVAEGLMGPYGAGIHTVPNGQAALNACFKNSYDLIFMDHMMDGMDGIETAEAIRKIKVNSCGQVPIVALTANAISGMREFFINQGFQDFLAKPIEMPKLDEILKRWLPTAKKTEYQSPAPESSRGSAGKPHSPDQDQNPAYSAFNLLEHFRWHFEHADEAETGPEYFVRFLGFLADLEKKAELADICRKVAEQAGQNNLKGVLADLPELRSRLCFKGLREALDKEDQDRTDSLLSALHKMKLGTEDRKIYETIYGFVMVDDFAKAREALGGRK